MRLFGGKRAHEAPAMPILQTARLVLRGFDLSDAVDVFAYANSQTVGPMAGWAPHQTVEDSRRVVEGFIRGGEVWAVVEKHTGRVIGSVGLHKRGARTLDGARELGYALGESYWGQGYATEACGAVLSYAFHDMGCPVVSAAHAPDNPKSKRVIKKLGFVYEGTLRCARIRPDGTQADELMYSLLREEYLAQAIPASK